MGKTWPQSEVEVAKTQLNSFELWSLFVRIFMTKVVDIVRNQITTLEVWWPYQVA